MDVQKFSYSVRTCLHGRRLLGIIKPIDIGPDTCTPCLEKKGNEGEWGFEFGQILGDEDFGYGFNHSLIDLLVGRIEWIVSNGYELNLQ